MMQTYRDPDFFFFAGLAKKLGISQERIENDLKTGKINKFLIDDLHLDSTPATKKRIARLTPVLNKFARDHLLEGPSQILTIAYTDQIKIKEEQKQILIKNAKSDSIFRLWLKEFGLDIDNIKLAIPSDEAARYEQYLKDIPGITGNLTYQDSFDAEKYIDNCLSQGKKLEEIAIELVEKYGTKKEKYYGIIGRKLSGHNENDFFSDETWRQRGLRFYKQIKNCMSKKM